jgi:hypothetical protein
MTRAWGDICVACACARSDALAVAELAAARNFTIT